MGDDHKKNTVEGSVISGEVHAGGDVVGRDKITNIYQIFIQQQAESGGAVFLFDYRGRIQNFLTEYLGTKNQPRPFGGRKEELKQLTTWLNTPQSPPYGLIAANAGRGKSALLVHWSSLISAQNTHHLVFHPISIRFDTAQETITLRALFTRLAQIYNEPMPKADIPIDTWREQVLGLLQRTPPDGKPLLLIIDGLDEASWEIGATLFPLTPPAGVRILVSARYQSGDVSPDGWLNRLNWAATLAQTFALPLLTKEGVADVLQAMGNPLDKLVTQVNVLAELHRLSEGEPLLVRLYVEALLPFGEQAPLLTPEQLPNIEKGLKGYFDRWWEEQEKLWQAQGRNPLEERAEVELFFNLCAGALGPLSNFDLTHLAPQELGKKRVLKKAAGEIRRFVVGDGEQQGYTLSHPKLNQYFWQETLFLAEQQTLECRFLAYGEQTVKAFNSGAVNPKQAYEQYAYIIQNYGTHLERATKQTQLSVPPEQFYALISKGWKVAWEFLSGTATGFLEDVGRGWAVADEQNHWAMQIKCALCFSSVTSVSAKMSPELLAMALKYNLLSFAQAQAFIQHTSDERHKANLIQATAFSVSLSTAQLQNIWEIISVMQDETFYVEALLALAPHLSSNKQEEIMTKALGMKEEHCSKILSALAPHLSPNKQEEVMAKALGMKEEHCSKILSALASHLSPNKQEEIMAKALGMKEEHCSKILSALAPHLSPNKQEEIMAKALGMKEEHCSNILSALAPYLSFNKQVEIMVQALAMKNAECCEEILSTIAPYLSSENQAIFLSKIWLKKDKWAYAKVLSTFAPYLQPDKRTKFIFEAFNIQYELPRAIALSALLPYLSSEQRTEFIADALNMQYAHAREKALSALLPYLSLEQRTKFRTDTLNMQYWLSRVKALSVLVPCLSPEQQEVIIDMALDMEDKGEILLSALIPHLSSEKQKNLMDMALDMQDIHGLQGKWGVLLSALIPHLLPEKREETLAKVLSIKTEWSYANILSALAPYLLPEQQAKTLAKALIMEGTHPLGGESCAAKVLHTLVPNLSPEKQKETLDRVLSMKNEEVCANILSAIAPYLFPELQAKVLAETLVMEDKRPYFMVLYTLIPHLSTEKQEEIFNKILTMEEEELQFIILIPPLASYLSPRLQEEFFDYFLIMEDDGRILSPLFTYLSSKKQEEMMTKVLVIENEGACAKVLSALTPHLSPENQVKVLDKALNMEDERNCTKVLSTLAPCLSPENQVKVLDKALNMEDEWNCTEVLSTLAPCLSPENQVKVLDKVLIMEYEGASYAKVLSALVPHLSPENQVKVLDKALNMEDEWNCTEVLSTLTPHLSPENQVKVLDKALNMENGWNYAEVLSTLAPYLLPIKVISVWKNTLHNHYSKKRGDLLDIVRGVLPLLWQIVGEERKPQVANEVAEVIFEVTEWWP